MKMTRWPQIAVILFACASGCFAQTCTITSPTSGQLFQTPQPLQLTATVSSAPTAYKLIWTVDYQRWANGYAKDPHAKVNDYRDAWQGPWTATWYTGLNGDGGHTVSGVVYDIFGNTLATCATIAFTVRIEGMSNQSLNAVPTSGTGQLGLLTFDGTNDGSDVFVDGYDLPHDSYCGGGGATSQSGGSRVPSFNTTCFPNGPHQILYGYNVAGPFIQDPYVIPLTITSVSGNNIAIQNSNGAHYSRQGSVVTFSNTGGSLPAPLSPGCQYFWRTSTSNSNTATIAISGGTITATLNNACVGLSGTVSVYLRNVEYTSATGLPLCDGLYTGVLSGSPATTLTMTAPAGCPNGVSATQTFELDVNPYFAIVSSPFTSIQVSATCTPLPCYDTVSSPLQPGSAVTLTSSGSGTSTVLQRIRSPYWSGNGSAGGTHNGDLVTQGAAAYVMQTVTFANGTKPMQLRPLYWEMHLVAGASATALCNASTLIINTDGTHASTNCSQSLTPGLSWTAHNDGGLSGVCSVDGSGNVTPLMAGWCQVVVACAACAAGGVSLPPVTTYVRVDSGSVTFPHFTHAGTIATSFSPGSSFYPLSLWYLYPVQNQGNVNTRALWLGPMMQEANINTFMIGADNFGDPGATSCPSVSYPNANHILESAIAAQYNLYYEIDISPTHWGSNGPGWLAAFLNNTGYDRQTCFRNWSTAMVSEGRAYRTYSYDELNGYMGGQNPFRNPNLGSTDFPTIIVSGCPGACVATYSVTETFAGVWSQSAGTGSWIKMAGAVANTCLNGWFPVTGITTISGMTNPPTGTSFTTPTTCGNGTYTESTAQLYHYFASAGSIGENTGILPRQIGSGAADGSNGVFQHWDATYFTQIQVAGCNGSTCSATFTASNCCASGVNGIASGQAVRVAGSSQNLNVVAPVTIIDANHFAITYRSLFGTLPSNGTYNSNGSSGATADANLYFTVDENFPPTPFLSLRTIINSVNSHPATTWSAIGLTYSASNPGVRGWEGSTTGADAAWLYIPQGPSQPYGYDSTVWQLMTYSQSSSGLATRGYQLPARSMLWSAGPDYKQFCPNVTFNPACDRPVQLNWRPETLVAQIMGMKTLGIRGLRLYNGAFNLSDLFTLDCCAWSQNGVANTTPGTGAGKGINPFISPKQWSAMAHTFALLKLREDTELQPEGNKPYLGPMFLTDAHTSSIYGNELTILCGSETPYGSQTIALPAISGGSVLKYVLTGYSLIVATLSGNPTTDSDEFCSSPGRATTYVALPPTPAVNPIDNITIAPPSPLPFGASRFLVQVGYYPRSMQDDPVTDCTSACTIHVDHHNTAAWYRVIYADSNNLPLSIGDPVQIPSQGLN